MFVLAIASALISLVLVSLVLIGGPACAGVQAGVSGVAVVSTAHWCGPDGSLARDPSPGSGLARTRVSTSVRGLASSGSGPEYLAAQVGAIGTGTGLVKRVVMLAQGQDPSGVLNGVLTNIRNWLMGLLVGLATLFLTIGGVRYLLAAGDPGEVDAAKRAFKSAAIGYALAALAPMFVEILRSLVGV